MTERERDLSGAGGPASRDFHPDDAVILGAVRTPVGRYGGALASVRPDDMAAHVIREVVQRTGVPADEIEDVYMGCANQAGEDNRNVARMAGLLAGLPVSVAGCTVNRLCASGLEAVSSAARAIKAGEGRLYVAGGVESMSRAPLVIGKGEMAFQRGNRTAYDTTLGWRFVNPALAELHYPYSMGETAENVAEKYGISREDQDEYAAESQARWEAAHKGGLWNDEIVPVAVPQRRGEDIIVDTDEHPRPGTTAEILARLRPAFREGGSVTAGNSSGINDGAAALVLSSAAEARRRGIRPMARIVSSAVAGVSPDVMGIGPVPAARKALERAGLTIDDIGLVELNEAFAAQVLACARELNIPRDRLNVNGGAIAIGHPLGMSGARIVTTLLFEMERRKVRYGLAALCIGVGQGMAMVVERTED